MKLTRLFLALFAGSLLFVSCSDDDSESNRSQGTYDNGTFVLNEGNGDPSTASVSFIKEDGTVVADIFKLENPTAVGTGSYLQSMFMDDSRIFMISGQANKITIVDRYSFKSIATVDTNIDNPRYGAVINGKAYVTNYANYATGDDDFLTVIDLKDYTSTKVALGNWSEKVLEENGKLYIANGYYGSGSSVTVFNTTSNTAEKVIELGDDSPDSFDEEDGTLYVLGISNIFKINLSNNQIAATITLPENLEGSSHLTVEDGKIYFTNGTSVYALDKNATAATEATKVLTYTSDSQWGAMYGFNVNDGKIYIADGGDFASDSKAFIYSLKGALLNTYTVGVGPNGFYFND